MLINVRTEQYSGSKFAERMGPPELVKKASETLASTRINGAVHTINPEIEEQLERFQTQHKASLTVLGKGLKGARVKNIVLEGGHIYTDETPGTTHDVDIRTTALLGAHLSRNGYKVKNVLMVDDFHPTEHRLDVGAYTQHAAELGWHIDHLVMESALAPIAQAVTERLIGMGVTRPEGNGLILDDGRKGAHLLVPSDGQWSCAVLDAALTIVKFKVLGGEGVVNVLSNEMKGQQRNTRQIVKAVVEERRLPFYNFFIDPNGRDPTTINSSAGAPHFFR